MTNKKLYRDPINAKLGGICAGIAHYFECEAWIVRLITILLFLLSLGTWVVIVYIALYFILDEAPQKFPPFHGFASDYQMKNKPWKTDQTAQQLLSEVDEALNQSENKIENIESYVTSFRFNMHQKFK